MAVSVTFSVTTKVRNRGSTKLHVTSCVRGAEPWWWCANHGAWKGRSGDYDRRMLNVSLPRVHIEFRRTPLCQVNIPYSFPPV